METLKKYLPERKVVKNNNKNTDTNQVFLIENSDFQKWHGTNSNPSKVISIAWRKAERLDNQIKKIMN